MKVSELVFVGIKGSVVALNRETGEQVWAVHLKGSDFVNVALQKDRLYATTYGEIFCLEAATGNALWSNGLKGFGLGLATIATEDSLRTELGAIMEKMRQEEREANSRTSST